MRDLKSYLLENVPILQQVQGAEFTQDENSISMNIPAAEGADYYFSVGYHATMNASLSASPLNISGKHFWWQIFDRYGDMTDQDVFDEMNEKLPEILQNPTKIVQKRGILNWSFQMYILINNTWAPSYCVLSPKWIKAPKIKGKIKEYFSPKIL
jgi:hypothetical protein